MPELTVGALIEKWRNMPDSPLDNLKEVAKLHAEELEAAWQAEQAQERVRLRELKACIRQAQDKKEPQSSRTRALIAAMNIIEYAERQPAPTQGDPNG